MGVPVAKMVLDRDDQNYTNIMSIVSVSERNTVCACIDLKRKFVWFIRAFSDTFKSFRGPICFTEILNNIVYNFSTFFNDCVHPNGSCLVSY